MDISPEERESIRKEKSYRLLNSARGSIKGVVHDLGQVPLADMPVELYIEAEDLRKRIEDRAQQVYNSIPEDYRKFL